MFIPVKRPRIFTAADSDENENIDDARSTTSSKRSANRGGQRRPLRNVNEQVDIDDRV